MARIAQIARAARQALRRHPAGQRRLIRLEQTLQFTPCDVEARRQHRAIGAHLLGVLPLLFKDGQSWTALGLKGDETVTL